MQGGDSTGKFGPVFAVGGGLCFVETIKRMRGNLFYNTELYQILGVKKGSDCSFAKSPDLSKETLKTEIPCRGKYWHDKEPPPLRLTYS